ncbi:MAG: DUF1647 domain-containing protein [Anaerolineales bacterium]|nr:DUF1647 domain-containing protein [Anaerolineales bacterium]
MRGLGRTLELRSKYLLLAPVPLRDAFVMVTGADRTHFKSLCNLLRSVAKWEPGMRCIVYDLGLEPDQRSELAGSFPGREVRRFDYSRYPPYVNIRINKGEYAWKPVIFAEVFQECRCSVAWFDAGNLLYEPLHWMRKAVQAKGFYSPLAKGTVEEWTHPATLAFLKADPSMYGKPNLAGYCVAANFRFPKARLFVERWRECALARDCIAPEGSNRYNHRQDMSVLSILAHQMRLPLYLSRFRLGFDCQQDVD